MAGDHGAPQTMEEVCRKRCMIPHAFRMTVQGQEAGCRWPHAEAFQKSIMTLSCWNSSMTPPNPVCHASKPLAWAPENLRDVAPACPANLTSHPFPTYTPPPPTHSQCISRLTSSRVLHMVPVLQGFPKPFPWPVPPVERPPDTLVMEACTFFTALTQPGPRSLTHHIPLAPPCPRLQGPPREAGPQPSRSLCITRASIVPGDHDRPINVCCKDKPGGGLGEASQATGRLV